MKTLSSSIETVAKNNEALIKSASGDTAFSAKDLHISEQVSQFVGGELPAISWNHGKLLVVNGRVIMTGGGNYWNQYRASDHDILDHQVKIIGDAAITAHEYTDYFFRYLNKMGKQNKNDSRSQLRCCSPSGQPNNWVLTDDAPFSPFKPANTGKYPVLTVGRIGDWIGTMKDVPFPVQVADALRDIALNEMWHILPESSQGETLAKLDFALRDDSTAGTMAAGRDVLNALREWWTKTKNTPAEAVPDMHRIFRDLQINPIAWASRYARKWVIERATTRVIIT